MQGATAGEREGEGGRAPQGVFGWNPCDQVTAADSIVPLMATDARKTRTCDANWRMAFLLFWLFAGWRQGGRGACQPARGGR